MAYAGVKNVDYRANPIKGGLRPDLRGSHSANFSVSHSNPVLSSSEGIVKGVIDAKKYLSVNQIAEDLYNMFGYSYSEIEEKFGI